MRTYYLFPLLLMGLMTYSKFGFVHTFKNKHLPEAQAKEYRIKFSASADREAVFEMDKCDISITGYEGDEIVITMMGEDEFTIPERAKGLKPLYNTAQDNTGIGLAVKQENNTVYITKVSNRGTPSYSIKVPRKISLEFEEVNHHGNDLSISGIEGNIKVETKSSKINLRNISGSVEASSIGGDINVEFAQVSQQIPSTIKAVGSTIDVLLPADTKADIRMKSISGEVYTDFDLALKDTKDGLRKVGGGNTVQGKVNGGGVAMDLESVGSDIFIRKKK